MALAEEDDGVSAGDDRERGDQRDGAGWSRGEGRGERGEARAEAPREIEGEEETGECDENYGGASEPAVGEVGERGGDDEGTGEVNDELGVVGAGGDDQLEATVAFAEGLDVLRGFEVTKGEGANEAAAGADDANGRNINGALAVDRIEAEGTIGAGREGQAIGDRGGGFGEVDPGDGAFVEARAGVVIEEDLAGGRGRHGDLDGEEAGLALCGGQKRHDDECAEERGDEEGREREELHAERKVSGRRAWRDKVKAAAGGGRRRSGEK